MPIFEYVCKDCNESFEKLVNREEEVTCPSCSGAHLDKQYSRFGTGGVESSDSRYDSLPMYKRGGGCCNPGGCGCKH